MNNTPLTKIDHAAAWTAKELMEQTDKWVYKLTDENLAELDTAFRQIKSKGLVAPFFGKDDFPIPKLAAKIEEFREQLESGLKMGGVAGSARAPGAG